MRKYSKNYIPPRLSRYDEFIPDGYISIHELFVVSDDVRKLYGFKVGEKLRKDTYNKVLDLYKKYGADKFDDFWNENVYEITKLRLNCFANFETIAPLCLLIKAFAHKKTTSIGTYNYISFGISIETMKKFIEQRKQCADEGKIFDYRLYTAKASTRLSKVLATHGEIPINVAKGTTVTMARNAMVKRFYDWCELQDITIREGILQAFELIMNVKRIDALKDLKEYEVVTEFDKLNLSLPPKKNTTCIKVKNISGELLKQTEDIITRMNIDPENHNRLPVEMDEYIISAIKLANSKMPLKYSSPDLLEQYKDVKETKDYMERAKKYEKIGRIDEICKKKSNTKQAR